MISARSWLLPMSVPIEIEVDHFGDGGGGLSIGRPQDPGRGAKALAAVALANQLNLSADYTVDEIAIAEGGRHDLACDCGSLVVGSLRDRDANTVVLSPDQRMEARAEKMLRRTNESADEPLRQPKNRAERTGIRSATAPNSYGAGSSRTTRGGKYAS